MDRLLLARADELLARRVMEVPPEQRDGYRVEPGEQSLPSRPEVVVALVSILRGTVDAQISPSMRRQIRRQEWQVARARIAAMKQEDQLPGWQARFAALQG